MPPLLLYPSRCPQEQLPLLGKDAVQDLGPCGTDREVVEEDKEFQEASRFFRYHTVAIVSLQKALCSWN